MVYITDKETNDALVEENKKLIRRKMTQNDKPLKEKVIWTEDSEGQERWCYPVKDVADAVFLYKKSLMANSSQKKKIIPVDKAIALLNFIFGNFDKPTEEK